MKKNIPLKFKPLKNKLDFFYYDLKSFLVFAIKLARELEKQINEGHCYQKLTIGNIFLEPETFDFEIQNNLSKNLLDLRINLFDFGRSLSSL
ncbi:hypothetical protein HOG75_00400 [bacterium]|jgi:hypothetical protein|nr:hypothetical protein [bacterium]MBT5988156.1 hypothetical protein [bacterium]